MHLIDGHTHVFDTLAGFGPRGELRAIGGGKARWANGDVISMIPDGLGDRAFTYDTLAELLKQNNVERAVLLQGSFYGFQNDYVQEAAKNYPDLFVPSGTFDPLCAEAEQLAERLIEGQKCRILKFETSSGGGLMGYHTPFDLDGSVFESTFARIASADATLVLDLGSPGMASFQPEAVAHIAEKYPSMRIVICHLLAPGLADGVALEKSLRILKLPNIWFDLAAIPWKIWPEQYPYPTGRGFIRLAKQLVGADKLIWGTDVPSVLTKDSYQNLLTYVTESDIFSCSELEGVLYGNACDAYAL